MFTYDLKFLSTDESIHIKETDQKTRKYESKKKNDQSIYENGKRDYWKRRGEKSNNISRRKLRELETTIRDRNIILCQWTSDLLITIIFSNGCLAYLSVNPENLEILKILFDKFCVGKISCQAVSVLLSRNNLLFLCSDGTATLISFQITSSHTTPVRISERGPHFQNIELSGGARRAENHLSWCDGSSGLRMLVWSTASAEPAPWSPIGEDRANLHLYQINGTQVNLLGYHQLDNETLSADISQVQENLVHIVDQTTYQINGVCLEWIRYEIPNEDGSRKLMSTRESVSQVFLPAPARAVKRSPCDSRLLVGCIDGSLHIVHKHAGLLHSIRAGFIATSVFWAGELIAAIEERGRIQCFDRALSLLQHHSKCIDLGQHLSECGRTNAWWRECRGGCAALVSFAGGPLAMLRVLHPRLSTGWIRSGRLSRALSLLQALDWNTEGDTCLFVLQELMQTMLRRRMSAETEVTAQTALGTYLAPKVPLEPTASRYAPAVNDLARKFFHHLLRRGRLDKTLSLGVDLRAWDLFADAHWAALRHQRPALAQEARDLALEHAAHESSCSDSCSQCSSQESSYATSEDESQVIQKQKAPPLPRVPIPTQPTIMPVPVNNSEPISTNSIRPNLHQYLERDLTIWNTDTQPPVYNKIKNKNDSKESNLKWHLDKPQKFNSNTPKWHLQPSHSVVDVIPRPRDERLGASQYGKVFQKELPEQAGASPKVTNMFRYHSEVPLTSIKHERTDKKPNGEKNKVKFSDTVTINVVSEEPRSCLVTDSALAPGTALDYVEV